MCFLRLALLVCLRFIRSYYWLKCTSFISSAPNNLFLFIVAVKQIRPEINRYFNLKDLGQVKKSLSGCLNQPKYQRGCILTPPSKRIVSPLR